MVVRPPVMVFKNRDRLRAPAYMTATGNDWSWPLFVWGALIGPFQVVLANVLTERLAIASIRPQEFETGTIVAERRARWRRQRVNYVAAMVVGLAIGVLSARLPSAWPDSLYTAWATIFGLVLPWAAYPQIKRRIGSQREKPPDNPVADVSPPGR
jgi:uncharacterized membrane protein YfcA